MVQVAVDRLAIGTLAGLIALAGAGCDAAGRAATLQVVVRDEALRVAGSPCAGTRPFLYIHRTASYRIEDPADGSTLVSGELPDGVAVEVLEAELAVERVPTNCELTFEVRLPERERYELVLERGDPLPFTAEDLDASQGRLRFPIP